MAIDLENWVLVLSYVNKAESSLDKADKEGKIASQLKCYSGLAQLANRSFEEAARVFLGSNFEHCSELPDVSRAECLRTLGALATVLIRMDFFAPAIRC